MAAPPRAGGRLLEGGPSGARVPRRPSGAGAGGARTAPRPGLRLAVHDLHRRSAGLCGAPLQAARSEERRVGKEGKLSGDMWPGAHADLLKAPAVTDYGPRSTNAKAALAP